jgi:hypothetical protein
LLGLLQNVLNLGFEFPLFLKLFLLSHFFLGSLLLEVAFSNVFLTDCLVDYGSLLFKVPHSSNQVDELEVGASLWTLVSQATILIGLVCWLLSIEIAIVEHMNADEVGHFVIHFFTFAKLESKVLVFLILL